MILAITFKLIIIITGAVLLLLFLASGRELLAENSKIKIYRSGTKYWKMFFDQTEKAQMVEIDIFFTQKNGCPIKLISKKKLELVVDIHVSLSILQSKVSSGKDLNKLEAALKKILLEEVQLAVNGLNADAIIITGGNLFQMIRPKIKKRMKTLVHQVIHIALIGQAQLNKNNIIKTN